MHIFKLISHLIFPDWKYWESSEAIYQYEAIYFRYSERLNIFQFTARNQGWMDLPETDQMAIDCRKNISEFT